VWWSAATVAAAATVVATATTHDQRGPVELVVHGYTYVGSAGVALIETLPGVAHSVVEPPIATAPPVSVRCGTVGSVWAPAKGAVSAAAADAPAKSIVQ